MKNSGASQKVEALDLEFPDWSEMVPSETLLPVESAFLLCEEYVGYFAKAFEERRNRRQPEDVVPFEL